MHKFVVPGETQVRIFPALWKKWGSSGVHRATSVMPSPWRKGYLRSLECEIAHAFMP